MAVQEPAWRMRAPKDLDAVVHQVDQELGNVIAIAAYVGDVSGDATYVSYTSLMIALLWSDDASSQWLRAFVAERNIGTDGILRHRGVEEEQRKQIMEFAGSNKEFEHELKDAYSRSSIVMLQTASSIARDTGSSEIGVRHLLAAFVFRNPSFHEQDVKTWGFDLEQWRREYAVFLENEYQDEISAWSEILRGVGAAADDGDSHAGDILSNYVFGSNCLYALRVAEALAIGASPAAAILSSSVLGVLLRQGEGADQEDLTVLRDALIAYPTSMSQLSDKLPIPASLLPPDSTMPFATQPCAVSVSTEFVQVLNQARSFALACSSSESISMRHLICALVVHANSLAFEALTECAGNLAELRRELLRKFTRRWTRDDGTAWRLILVGVTPPSLAGFDSDDPDKGGDDRLDVTRYATAFATVLAAKSVKPPLSIGVFGDWGSGKSFFMRLMREQTDRVCRLTDIDANNERIFCTRVKSIKFNAWHYADTNLWASLVQTILEELQSEIKDENDLELVQAAKAAAQEKLESAIEARQEAEQELRSAQTATESRTKNVDRAKSVIEAFAKNVFQFDEGVLDSACKSLGIDIPQGFSGTVEELKDLTDDLRDEAEKIRSHWHWFKRKPAITELILWVGGSIVLGSAVLYGLAHADLLDGLQVFLGEVVVVVSTVVVRIRSSLQKFAGASEKLSGIRARIDTRESELEQSKPSLIERAESDLEHARAEQEVAQTSFDMANETYKQAEKGKKSIVSSKEIASLIERRLDGRDYEQYLSITTAIRNDFETLSSYLSHNDGSDAIERIVLYIDDLDRCPSEKVVQVLEAVHLMLAFPLFVVVVGVDIRWAGTSLHETYPKHLTSGLQDGDDDDRIDTAGASALDYLEKIFQIPFWLPPMEEEASRNMISAMIPIAETDEDTPDQVSATVQEIAQSSASESDDVEVARQQGNAQASTDASAEALEVESGEREYMLSLAAAVGKSPRRLKRFVNTYRILKASCDALERDSFVLQSGDEGTYRSAMTLLAIATGAPYLAIEILRKLHRGEYETFAALEDDVADINRHDVEETYAQDALKIFKKATANGADSRLDDLRYWTPRAARFSFRSGRI